jgi:hypothetical protein
MSGLDTGIVTYADLVDYVIASNMGGARSKELTFVKAAVHAAFREVWSGREWAFYRREYRIDLVAPYDTGTVAFDFTGGSSERLLTLTDGTWPIWAKYGRIRIDNRVYEVEDRLSSTTLQLTQNMNPGEDIAAGETYELYRTVYSLPPDLLSIETVIIEDGPWSTHRLQPREWLELERRGAGTGNVWGWTIKADPDLRDRWAIFVHPRPSEAEPMAFTYMRRPAALRWSGTESTATPTASGSSGASTLVISATLPQSMVGAIIRLNDTSNKPTGLFGVHPYIEQHQIKSISGTTVTLNETTLGQAFASGTKVVVSSLVDIRETMMQAVLDALDYRLATMAPGGREGPSIVQAYQRFTRSLIVAKEHDAADRTDGAGLSRYSDQWWTRAEVVLND